MTPRRGRPRTVKDKRPAGPSFWGTPPSPEATDDTPPPPIRPTADPSALPRSLGDPPLGPGAAPGLAAVYDEAVRAATALAAINGLLELPDTD